MYIIDILFGIFIGAVATFGWLNKDIKAKPKLPSEENLKEKQLQQDFNAMMNYNVEIATQRKVGE